MASSKKPNARLRKQIRDARRAIPAPYAVQASYRISEQVALRADYRVSERVSGFLPFDGEISPLPLLDRALQEGKQVFVPMLRGKTDPLRFARWTRDAVLQKNRFGIDEPAVPESEWISASQLDLALFPLVAFDRLGNRIGVGGGYYDRSFAFTRTSGEQLRPALIGLAYELQCVEEIEPADWDIRLDAVVTELQTYPS